MDSLFGRAREARRTLAILTVGVVVLGLIGFKTMGGARAGAEPVTPPPPAAPPTTVAPAPAHPEVDQAVREASDKLEKIVADDLRARFPNANLTIENRSIGGHAAQLLVKTAEADL